MPAKKRYTTGKKKKSTVDPREKAAKQVGDAFVECLKVSGYPRINYVTFGIDPSMPEGEVRMKEVSVTEFCDTLKEPMPTDEDPKPLSSREKDALCEEYLAIQWKPGMSISAIVNGKHDNPRTDWIVELANKEAPKRRKEIENLIGQDYLDEYRERKELEKRMDSAELSYKKAEEKCRSWVRSGAMLTISLAVLLVVSLMLR
ncbi:hypothetical protein [Blastopirellula marina]|uniref:Uncharacterized protein n=1 Tax=Blastopirellula marina TaxID=124 RepID=A0A2S8GSP1_9BACT|nr:hypothetical protein [Blastopirellula marina]PQO47391.1 hypothetical protein C5Y93_04935 [Blastopirellula marina]